MASWAAAPSALVGQTLGHYRVVEKIGSGGMGEVYRARDLRLEREVALKILPPGTLSDESARKRFRKEALALSKLNHPNIETIHDFDTQAGVDFLVMEYICGRTLDTMLTSPLPEREIIHLGSEMAEGLAAAHEEGVVHRDLKPSNLRITPDGRLKILDFGLAKIVREPGPEAPTESLSGTEGAVGTPPYMAPEQLLGEKVDARTDIWAAGAVLYEMATRQRPFPGRGPRLADAILHQPPMPPSGAGHKVSAALEAIILKCLEKDSESRYQSAKDLLVDLRRLTTRQTAPLPARHSWYSRTRTVALFAVILVLLLGVGGYFAARRWSKTRPPTGRVMLAVLPFDNLSGDPEQEYFSDGLTEEVIARLGSLQPKRLGVIARTSAMGYKKSDKSIAQIGRELAVDYVLESSVRRDAGRVRITVQLIQVSDQTELWGETYERESAGVFALQSEVARRVAGSLAIQLLPGEQAGPGAGATTNPEAHEAYLRAHYELNKRTNETLLAALGHFKQAIALDPNYAAAYAGLADTYVLLGAGDYAVLPPREAMPQASAAARKALALDNELAEAHTTLAFVDYLYTWDWTGAEGEFRKAVDLNPSYANAHHWLGMYLKSVDGMQEARAEMQTARALDPLALIINSDLAVLSYWARDYDAAVQQYQRTLELDPNFAPAHWGLGRVYAQKRMFPEAITETERAMGISGRSPVYVASLAHAYALSGGGKEARALLAELARRSKREHIPAYDVALVYSGLGENDDAIRWLHKAYEDREDGMVLLRIDFRLNPLRADPRFQELVRRMDFPR